MKLDTALMGELSVKLQFSYKLDIYKLTGLLVQLTDHQLCRVYLQPQPLSLTH